MTKIKLSPSERLIDSVCKPIERPENADNSGLPYVTHAGILKIDDKELRCYILSTGERIFDAEDVANFFK